MGKKLLTLHTFMFLHQIPIDCMEMDSEYLAGLVIANRVPNAYIYTYLLYFTQYVLVKPFYVLECSNLRPPAPASALSYL